MINLNQTVFIMDGPSDIRAFTGKLQKEFGSTPDFRKAPCNGHTVSPEGYVNGVQGIINFALNSNYLHIFCVLDREKRRTSAVNLAIQIKTELISILEKNSKISNSELNKKIKIVVADRMMENWIIADIEGIKEASNLIKGDAAQKGYDGAHGVKVLKEIMYTKYDKVQHAPILLKKISIERAKQNSPSFSNFITALEI
ncbi:MAG: DUF4276 family protein [Methylomarinum sp.]|nr:DUF4276 family protein [Methylomarinum sp.]